MVYDKSSLWVLPELWSSLLFRSVCCGVALLLSLLYVFLGRSVPSSSSVSRFVAVSLILVFFFCSIACCQLMDRYWGLVFDLLVTFPVGLSIHQVVRCGCSRKFDIARTPFDLRVVFFEPW